MEAERERVRSFRRALSKKDQEAFDRLIDRTKMHTSAGVYMSNPWPMETSLLSVLLEHGKMIEEILGLLKEKKGLKITTSPIWRCQRELSEVRPEFISASKMSQEQI